MAGTCCCPAPRCGGRWAGGRRRPRPPLSRHPTWSASSSGPWARRRPRPVKPKVMRQLTDLMGEAWKGVRLVEPQARWHQVDGRRIQGWFYEAPAKRGKPAPLVVEIHGGPATLYGFALMWEWQALVASGISVYACNPRGSTGYGQAFAKANFRDWGAGPQADIEAGVDTLVGRGLADADAPRRDRRLVWWLSDRLDDRPQRPLRRRRGLPGRLRHDRGDAQRRPRRPALRPLRARRAAVGGPRAVSAPEPADLRRATSARRCSSSTPSRTCAAPSPRPRSCSRCCARCGVRCA